jgi:hypothetical protein
LLLTRLCLDSRVLLLRISSFACIRRMFFRIRINPHPLFFDSTAISPRCGYKRILISDLLISNQYLDQLSESADKKLIILDQEQTREPCDAFSQRLTGFPLDGCHGLITVEWTSTCLTSDQKMGCNFRSVKDQVSSRHANHRSYLIPPHRGPILFLRQ